MSLSEVNSQVRQWSYNESSLVCRQPESSTEKPNLTDQEKKFFVANGLAIPTRLPLTKDEEDYLIKFRRRISNQIAARKSRLKKKAYVEQLKVRVEVLEKENAQIKRRVHELKEQNKTLINQVKSLV